MEDRYIILFLCIAKHYHNRVFKWEGTVGKKKKRKKGFGVLVFGRSESHEQTPELKRDSLDPGQ